MNDADQTNVLVWIHGDCLSPYNPASVRYPGAPAAFVFDDTVLSDYGLTLKRIGFMYECLLEIPHIAIYKGDVVAELTAAATIHGCTRIATTHTVAPRFMELARTLQRSFTLEVLPAEPFISPRQTLDLGRFSRYWAVAEPYVLGNDE